MSSIRIASMGLLSVFAACASGPPLRAAVPAAHLVPELAATAPTQAVALRAAPVQLGATYGAGRDGEHHLLPVTMRLALTHEGPFRPLPWWSTTRPFLNGIQNGGEPVAVPALPAEARDDFDAGDATDDSWAFNERTVPLLPYGAFWVEVTNRSDHAITVSRSQLRLREGDRTSRAIDSGAIEGRYDLAMRGVQRHGFGEPVESLEQERARAALPMFDRAITLAPGASYSGYVVFDTKSYTADEYNHFLADAGQVTLELTSAATTLASVAFQNRPTELPALCLPGTAQPSFARCEVMAQ